MRRVQFIAAGLLSAILFSGFSLTSFLKKKEVPAKPQMFVFPFDCDCVAVDLSSSVTGGFISGMPATLEVLDLKGFESYLTTMNVTMAEVTGAVRPAPPVDSSAGAQTGSADPSAPPAATSTPAETPASETPRVETPRAEAPPFEPPNEASYSKLVADLFRKRAAREQFYKTTEIEYVAIGRAKEKKLSALEAGNLITLQTADIKIMDVKTGEIIVDDSFKQGIFEVVAAERVGKKLANKVIDKFKEIAKDDKRQRKLDKQREKRRRALTD